ncbi:PREDICTED: protein MIZU-KUSSEI 1 [Lupinus angustifolius]|nr:PREDICTED: protein MIZU-KUSSEI 1 [Lupinus angustifolius]
MAIDTLRRFFLPCFFPTTTTTTTKPPLSLSKKHPNTSSLRHTTTTTTSPSSSTSSSSTSTTTLAPPRPSKSMVVGTIFGNRNGHVWFSIQHDRLSFKPTLLLELPISTNLLVREMQNGVVRIALESNYHSTPLRSIPVWTVFCNGKKTGFAAKRKASEHVRSVLRTMQCVTVGAGVIPSRFRSSSDSGLGLGSDELMYMRANFEHVVGNADNESFHLINPDDCPGQELSVFLLRSTLGVVDR